MSSLKEMVSPDTEVQPPLVPCRLFPSPVMRPNGWLPTYLPTYLLTEFMSFIELNPRIPPPLSHLDPRTWDILVAGVTRY